MIEVLLFDLGGVLIELSGVPTMRDWSGETSDEMIWQRWLSSAIVRKFEAGGCTPMEFADGIVEEFDLPVSAEEFIQAFTHWPKLPFSGAVEMLKELRPSFTLACLSNTNELHWDRFCEESDLMQQFHHSFPSHLTGLLKPDRIVFDHVKDELAIEPSKILFFDDNQLNVDGAMEAGLCALKTIACDGVKTHLRAEGILP
jgi:putative hydrolase of the HAD superfamily|tara:strand:- start:1226 stop:1825 length:600 start_codon:yes stop_codon:yes gene_type:complete